MLKLWTRGGNTEGINLLKNLARKLFRKKLPPSGHSKKRDELLSVSWIQKLWLTIAILDLIRIYAISIRWHLFTNKIVICDRYLWDTLIDFKINFSQIQIEKWYLWKFLVLISPKPNKSILLVIPLEESNKRCSEKYEPFPDTPKIRKFRHSLYMDALDKHYWTAIDSMRPIDVVFTDIKNT